MVKEKSLTQEGGVWTEESEDIALQKVSNLFRNPRKMLAKKEKEEVVQVRVQTSNAAVRAEIPDGVLVESSCFKRATFVWSLLLAPTVQESLHASF